MRVHVYAIRCAGTCLYACAHGRTRVVLCVCVRMCVCMRVYAYCCHFKPSLIRLMCVALKRKKISHRQHVQVHSRGPSKLLMFTRKSIQTAAFDKGSLPSRDLFICLQLHSFVSELHIASSTAPSRWPAIPAPHTP